MSSQFNYLFKICKFLTANVLYCKFLVLLMVGALFSTAMCGSKLITSFKFHFIKYWLINSLIVVVFRFY